MKPTTLGIAAISMATATAIAISGAPVGSAAAVQPFGTRELLNDGMMVTAYTVTGLRASGDTIPWPVNGRLYEATVKVAADRGTITPMIPWFNARAASGQTYRVLNAVATPQGLNPRSLAQGEESTGKIYFDVVGDMPNSVVFNDGMDDLLLWVGTAGAAAPEAAPMPAAPMPAPEMPAPMMPAAPAAPAAPPPPAAPMVPEPMMPAAPAAPAEPAAPPPPATPMMPGY